MTAENLSESPGVRQPALRGLSERIRSSHALDLVLWVGRTYLRRHSFKMAMAGACMAVSAASLAGLAWLVQPALSKLLADPGSNVVYLIPLGVVAILTINGFAIYGQQLLTQTVGQRVVVQMQSDLFRRFISWDLATQNGMHSGRLISVNVSDAGMVLTATTAILTGVARDLVMFASLTAVMFARDWALTLATFVALPLLAVGVRAISRHVRRSMEQVAEETVRFTALLSEAFAGARLIKLSGSEPFEIDRHRASARRRSRLFLKVIARKSMIQPVNEVSTGIAIALVIGYGISRAAEAGEGTDAFTGLASFLAALVMAHRPVKRIAASMADLQIGIVAASRIRNMLSETARIVDRPGARPLELTGPRVAFEGVTFSYDGKHRALDGIDLVLEPGRTVALVGPSGGGKTTLISLVPRLYDVEDGRITIDGQDIRDLTLASLRAAIAVVSQETMLFDDTVRANIAYGVPSATDREVERVARAASAHDFITALPKGYDTVVGERGFRLSGGQRQRLAIARAMLKDAPILLLDEATSALDNLAETAVKQALQKLVAGRTTLIVAHRLSSVIDADEIHVVLGGRIVESGRHQELMDRGGAYAQLYAIESFERRYGPLAAGSR